VAQSVSAANQLLLIDSHCHLADEAFAGDLGAVVARAREAGVAHGLCILAAGDEQEAAQAARLADLWPACRFSAGVHPHQAGAHADRPDQAVEIVRRALAGMPLARAVGEIGLDYHYDFAPRAVQQEVFRRQVALARERDLPVVIHTREAEADTFQILREEGRGEVRGIFHCFTGDAAAARRALDLGFHVSFAGIVTFPRATALREAAALVPADRLLIETDAPYLAPVPHRGKRNEPAWVGRVAEALADVRGTTAAELGERACRTFEALLRP
jgi:TatD DNase family protein